MEQNVHNGTIQNGTMHNGTIHNGTIHNGTITKEEFAFSQAVIRKLSD